MGITHAYPSSGRKGASTNRPRADLTALDGTSVRRRERPARCARSPVGAQEGALLGRVALLGLGELAPVLLAGPHDLSARLHRVDLRAPGSGSLGVRPRDARRVAGRLASGHPLAAIVAS